MKKFLAICLTLSMLIGCMTFFTLSASAAGVKTLVLHDCEDTDHGLGVAGAAYLDKQEYVEGSASIATKLTGKLEIAGINFNKGFDKPIDITEYTHLSFDFYVSDLSKIAGTDFWFELTSTGGPDHGESTYHTTYGALLRQNGWNEIKIPLSAFTEVTDGGLDKTKFNYFRWFCNSGVDAGDGLTLRIDNIRFEDRGEVVNFEIFSAEEAKYMLYSSANTNDRCRFTDNDRVLIYYFEIPEADVPYVSEATVTIPFQGESLIAVSSDGCNYKTAINETVSDAYSATRPTTINLMDYVDFSVSNGIFVSLSDADTTDGWGCAVYNQCGGITFSYSMSDKAVRGATECIRFAVNSGEWGTDAKVYNPVKKVFGDTAFDIGNEPDTYTLRVTATKKHDSDFFYSDTTKEYVLAFDIARASDVKGISFNLMTGQQLLLQVSADDANWETVYSAPKSEDTHAMTVDLTGFIDFEVLKETGKLYIRIADVTPENGWGGKIFGKWPTTLTITRGIPTGGAVSVGEGAIMGMKRIFNSYTLLRNCPFLSRIFGIK